MRHGSLFSGIGGFDLAARWMGWENVFQVEKDKHCRAVLEKNFEGVKRYGDVREFGKEEFKGGIDIISAGFPCQPFSVSGKREGKSDDRYLWPECVRVIREFRPTYFVGENVTGIISLALDQVLSDLEVEGYTTETFVIPASALGAWHKRERVWILAYSTSDAKAVCPSGDYGPKRGISKVLEPENLQRQDGSSHAEGLTAVCSDVSNTNDVRRKKPRALGQSIHPTKAEIRQTVGAIHDRFQHLWQSEPAVGRVVDGLPNRVDRLRGLGNSLVPQIAFTLFQAIEALDNQNQAA